MTYRHPFFLTSATPG